MRRGIAGECKDDVLHADVAMDHFHADAFGVAQLVRGVKPFGDRTQHGCKNRDVPFMEVVFTCDERACDAI